MQPTIGRRELLRRAALAAGVVATGTFAGCSTSTSSSSTTTSTGRPGTSTSSPSTVPPTTATTVAPTTSSTVPQRPPTSGDWSSLGKRLDGSLVLPGDTSYGTDAQLYNPVFDGARPQGIAYCASPADVAASIAFSRDHALALAVRCGGHSYGGYSIGPGLVLDVTKMSSTSFHSGSGVMTVGSGCRLIDLYGACAAAGVAVPGGSCPTVGIAGLALGGGIGVVGRRFGLTCDAIVSADIVTADGSMLTASASENSDLFWALRGAGGGNFGVVTELAFASAPLTSLGLFTLVYEWHNAPAVVAAWQEFFPSAPDELWANCLLVASQSTPNGFAPVARITGVYVGSQSALESALQPFLDAVGAQPFDHFVGSATYLQAMLIEGGCENDTVAQCHLPSENPAGLLSRAPSAAKSDYLGRPLSSAGINTVLAAVEARQTSPVLSGGGVVIDASGGAINRVSPTATAFVHRNDLATLQYAGEWPAGASAAEIAANHAWLQSTWQSMRPYVTGQAYQNYIDPDLTGWAAAYYGQNLPRLEQVKLKYDPDDVFRFAQSIPLPR